ncbi:hypothetical protein ACHHYP_09377 [Achlya hypogyna]|uniref:Uncharacterized protein n=1 Tax=Achlya hypogyna TaxID=1202772 RepID=A0A1V9ZJ16_ACHHY|nr:hypothetical protein ACHHYP_09377 [Achlya hypogyna]
MSLDLRRRLSMYLSAHPHGNAASLVQSGSIEDKLRLLCNLFQLEVPTTFAPPSDLELVRFRRWIPASRSQEILCDQLRSSKPTVRNIHTLRQLLSAGMYLVQQQCHLQLISEPSVGHFCMLLKETNLTYVKKAISPVDFLLIVRQVFHHGIFQWPPTSLKNVVPNLDPIAVYLSQHTPTIGAAGQ